MKSLPFFASLVFVVRLLTPAQAANDPYYDWIVSHWGLHVVTNEANRHTVWGEQADPDGDGISNLFEYATGINPKVWNHVSDAYNFILPTEGADSARFPEITARIRIGDPELRVTAQTTSDLRTWTPSGTIDFSQPQASNPAVHEIPTDEVTGGFRRYRYIDQQSMAGRVNAFMRLRISRRTEVTTGAPIEPFFFTDGQIVKTGTVARSNSIVVGGFAGTVEVSIPSGVRLYRNGVLLNPPPGPTPSPDPLGGPVVGETPLTVQVGDVIWMEANAPASSGVLRQYTLNIGGVSSTWSFKSGTFSSVPDHGGTESGYTAVETGVSDTGAAQVNIPIVVSPGTAGMQPKLSIGYSSQGGNGPLGAGFSLNGLSAISRVGKTIAQDGVKSGVNFNADDRFALDGQRLIAIVGPDGEHNTEYRLEFDPTSRIRSYGRVSGIEGGGFGPEKWIVETKAGLLMEYSAYAESERFIGGSYRPGGTRVGFSIGSGPISWAISSISDTLGNTISFEYSSPHESTEILLVSKISYTSNVNGGLSPTQEVVFEYEQRPDVSRAFTGGFELLLNSRLRSIESRNLVNGSNFSVRKYNLTYDVTPSPAKSRLINVDELRPDGSMSSTQIIWSQPVLPAFTSRYSPVPPDNGVGGIINSAWWRSADFDGNGINDILTVGTQGFVTTLIRTPTGFTDIRWTPPADSLDRNVLEVGDFDADGMTDIVTRAPGNHTNVITHFSNGDGTYRTETFANSLAWESGKTISADFNGDGRTDIFNFRPGHATPWRVFFSNGDGTYTVEARNYSFSLGVAISVGDFNGDGIADLVTHLGGQQWTTYLSDGRGNFSELIYPFPLEIPITGSTEHPSCGDFNGDGISDLTIRRQNKLYTFLFSGTGNLRILETPIANNHVLMPHVTGDFNGDGAVDIYGYYIGGVIRFLSNGDGTFTTIAEPTDKAYEPSHMLSGDFDGDGSTDFVSDWNGQLVRYESGNLNLNWVTAVQTSHGHATSFSYRPITDGGNLYTSGEKLPYPCLRFSGAIYVVSSMTARNGNDGDAFSDGSTPVRTNTVNYRYVGAWSCLDGRGFMGFQWVETTDPTSGIVTHTQFETDPLKAGRVKATRQDLISPPPGGSGLIGYSTTSWNVTPTVRQNGLKTYFVAEAVNFSNSYEVNRPSDVPIKSVTRFGPGPGSSISYDGVGNVLEMTTNTTNGSEDFQETVFNTYSDVVNPSIWLLGRLATSRVVKWGPDPAGGGLTALTRESSFAYHSTTGLLTQEVEEPGGGALRKQKDYTHDAFGNILTSTITVQGEDPRMTSTTYTTDGRFVATTTNALGHSESKTYDPVLGNVLTQTGPNGLTTSWQYDAIGRPIRETRPDGTVTRSFYRRVTGGTVGAPPRAVHYVRAQSSGGAPKTVWYDLLDREIRTDGVGFDGRTVSAHQVYNARGEVTHASQPYFAGDTPLYSTSEYDAVGRPVLTNDPGNRIARTTYNGLTTTVERNFDPNNPSLFQKAVTVVNVMGWTVSSSQYLETSAKTITKRYDPYGNLRFVVDPAGNTTEIRYDVKGNKVWMSEPNSGATSYTHNGFGEMKTQTNSANQTVSLSYDKLGRVLTRSEPEGVTQFFYDTAPMGKGQLARELMDGFERRHFYDGYGRPASSVEYHGPRGFAVSRGYDMVGRPDTLTYPTGFSTRQVYTTNGHLCEVRNGSDNTAYWKALAVNVRGQVGHETLGNGIETNRTFETATGVIQTIQSGISDFGVGRDLQDLSFAFDLIGNLRERRDTRFSTPFSESFTYDTLNRLKTVDTSGGVAVIAGYNDIGNLTSRSDVGSFAYSGARPHALTSVNGGNFNKVCEYDAKGNRTQDGGTILAYSSYNKPVTIQKDDDTLSFAYGPDRNLYRQVIVADAAATPSMRDYIGGLYERETLANGDVRHVHYIAGGNGVVAIHTDERSNFGQESQRTRYVHKDHLGSVDVISDSAGQEVERQSYDAWGRRRTVTHSGGNWTVTYPVNPGSNETRRGFTGHEMLDLVGLVHMGGRVYDPISARFLSPDPFVQAPDNLQNLNRYSYVLNNPLSYTDPSGFFFKSIGKWLGKNIKNAISKFVGHVVGAIVGTVAFIASGFNPAALYVGYKTGYGFGSSFSGTLLAGGSVGDALRAGLRGAATGFANALIDLYVPAPISFAARAVVNGIVAESSGGSFQHGFGSYVRSSAIASVKQGAADVFKDWANAQMGEVKTSCVGGTSSAIGGGKFGNGAMTMSFMKSLKGESTGEPVPSSVQKTPIEGEFQKYGLFDYSVDEILGPLSHSEAETMNDALLKEGYALGLLSAATNLFGAYGRGKILGSSMANTAVTQGIPDAIESFDGYRAASRPYQEGDILIRSTPWRWQVDRLNDDSLPVLTSGRSQTKIINR